MKQFIIFFTFLFISLVYADAPCKEENITKEIFTKKYPHNIMIKKEHFSNGCGIKKDTIEIFQNNKKIDTLSGFYDVKLRSDDQIDKHGNRKIIFTVYGGGHGTERHAFGTIEANMKKLFYISGYDIRVDDIDKDGNKEIILPKSIFFCISDQFCSHASSLHIDLILKFENNTLMIAKKLMQEQSKPIQPCITNVQIKNQDLNFSDKACATNNLKKLAYNLYSGDIEKLENTLKYFKFETPIVKERFKKVLLGELKGVEFVDKL